LLANLLIAGVVVGVVGDDCEPQLQHHHRYSLVDAAEDGQLAQAPDYQYKQMMILLSVSIL
jgi:hypothetical protein